MDVNVTAPINSLGYGVVGLNIVLGLERIGHSVALWPIGEIEAPEEHHSVLRRTLDRRQTYDPRAPSLRLSQQVDLAQHVGKGLHCALPIFELDRFDPVEHHHLSSQDRLVVPSRWAMRVLADNGIPEERIRVAPLGVDREIFRFVDRVEPGPTVFLNVGKWEVRKGHDILAEAFGQAFSRKDDVQLVLVSHNPFYSEDESRQWGDAYRGSLLGEKIQIIAERLPSQRDVAAVMARADCGVFPFRAEGWNLDLAEMMAMGKNVIATNYSAPTEYLTPDNARLIQVDGLEDAIDAKWFHGQGRWAALGESQMEQLVTHMRDVHRLKQDGRLRPNTVARDTMSRLTWDNAAACIAAAVV